jgi:hypothetical protein
MGRQNRIFFVDPPAMDDLFLCCAGRLDAVAMETD